MVSQPLADGGGPLYREARGDDLAHIIENVTRVLSRRHPADSAMSRRWLEQSDPPAH
jgi:hypothetical protein